MSETPTTGETMMYEDTVFMRNDLNARIKKEKHYVRAKHNEKFFTLLKDATGVHVTASEVETYKVVDHLINDLHVKLIYVIPAPEIEELISLQGTTGLVLKTESDDVVLVIRGSNMDAVARKVAKLLLSL